MSSKPSLVKHIRQYPFIWLALAAVIISLVAALWINLGVRAAVEAGDKTAGLLVDYDELKRLADGSLDITFADMLRKAGKAGATGIVVRERILADWESAGDIAVFTGGQLGAYLALQGGELPFVPEAAATYILTKDSGIYEQLYSLLEAKRRYPQVFDLAGYSGIAVRLHSSERATLGLGFPMAQLEEAAAAGFQIIPRLRNWEPVRPDNLAAVFGGIGKIPNLAGVGFNDLSVPGGGANPVLQDRLAAALKPLGKPLISFEFYDQAGLAGLAARLDNQVLRAHAIAENELRKYSDVRDAMDRFNLAATERNIRYIYLRFYGLENPAASADSNMELIAAVRAGLEAEGFSVGEPRAIASFHIPFLLRFLTGAGVAAAGGWLLALGARPFVNKKWLPPYAVLAAAAYLAWGVLLLKAPVLAQKLWALAAAVVFPSLGILLVLVRDTFSGEAISREIASPGRKPGPAQAARAAFGFLAMSAWTLAGAMIMSALLAEPAFMLKLDGFTGVKVSHLIPLVLVPCILWLREKDWLNLLTGTAKSSVRLWQLAVGLIVLAGLALYILRTGNDSLGAVSDIEMKIRTLLDRILGVRPRTKEFLIGHPAMLVLLYFGYRFNMFPLLLIGSIGQISLINTYAHIHTPLMISFVRSFHGLWIGLILGSLAAGVILWLLRLLPRFKAYEAERGGGA